MRYTSSYDRYELAQSPYPLAQTTLCIGLCRETYELVVRVSVRM